jgi:hypothetical protein
VAGAERAEGISEANDGDCQYDHKLRHVCKDARNHADKVGGLHKRSKEVQEFHPLHHSCNCLELIEQLVFGAIRIAAQVGENENQGQRFNVIPSIEEVSDEPLIDQLIDFKDGEPNRGDK